MADQVRAWGYPREVSEAESSFWVTWGTDSVAWFEPTNEPTVFSLHACTSPDAPNRDAMDTERTKIAIEVVAELLGAEALVSLLPKDMPGNEGLRKLLLSRGGWVESEHGVTKPLGVY